MSRIGKMPVSVPSGVEIKIGDASVSVKGPKGALERRLPPKVSVKLDDGKVTVAPENAQDRISRSMFGLTRTLIANMVEGVQNPFKKSLEVVGVGYRAELKGSTAQSTGWFVPRREREHPEGSFLQGRQAHDHPPRVGGQGARGTNRGRDSFVSAPASPTRAKASNIRTSACAARKARPAPEPDGSEVMERKDQGRQPSPPGPPGQGHSQDHLRDRRASAAQRLPKLEAYLCPADRRRHRHHGGRGFEPDQGGA